MNILWRFVDILWKFEFETHREALVTSSLCSRKIMSERDRQGHP